MTFRFSNFCELLSTLESLYVKIGRRADRKLEECCHFEIKSWFRAHRHCIDSLDAKGIIALLSALFPEGRTDRVYGIKEASLVRLLGRCFCISRSRMASLERYKVPGGGDLGYCVEQILKLTPMPGAGSDLKLEEIDEALEMLASQNRFSDAKVRQKSDSGVEDIVLILQRIYWKLGSVEAKWFTRMLLKNYAPICLPQNTIMKEIHFLLPGILKFQCSFDAAAAIISDTKFREICRSARNTESVQLQVFSKILVPRIGVKVGSVPFLKARSIKHCVKIAGKRIMSMERKYDGEYCQIHVDLDKGPDSIQIFSKSGKDSTIDRRGLHAAIRKGLRIGESDCHISDKCIIEGELLVWSEKDACILPFDEIRRYVSRSGTFIGIENDSPQRQCEHLMIMFYDILLLDDDVVMTQPHHIRRKLLERVVAKVPGWSDVAEREIIHFSSANARERLKRIFARGITQRWEGFVLKGSDEPYFSLSNCSGTQYSGAWIKLKKDYIQGLWDTVDLAIIGACYDEHDTRCFRVGGVRWTRFFVGCLENKEQVRRFNAKPLFRIVQCINQIPPADLQSLNELGKFRCLDYSATKDYDCFDVKFDIVPHVNMDVIFQIPFVFEVLGFGVSKQQGQNFYTLRFPRVVRVHLDRRDRTFKDALSFCELQQFAQKSIQTPTDDTSQEDIVWIDRLEAADPRSCYLSDDSASNTESLTPVSTQASNESPQNCNKVDTNMAPMEEVQSAKERSDTSEGLLDNATESRTHVSQNPDHQKPMPSPSTWAGEQRETSALESHSLAGSSGQTKRMRVPGAYMTPFPMQGQSSEAEASALKAAMSQTKMRVGGEHDKRQVDTGFLPLTTPLERKCSNGSPLIEDENGTRCTCNEFLRTMSPHLDIDNSFYLASPDLYSNPIFARVTKTLQSFTVDPELFISAPPEIQKHSKVMLVDPEKGEPCLQFLQSVCGCMRRFKTEGARIDIWDWRVLMEREPQFKSSEHVGVIEWVEDEIGVRLRHGMWMKWRED